MQRGRANIVDGHLKGALTIMNSCQGDLSPTSVFLERVRVPRPSISRSKDSHDHRPSGFMTLSRPCPWERHLFPQPRLQAA